MFQNKQKQIWFLKIFIQFSMHYITTIRSSRSQMFFEIGVLKVCNILRKTPVLESHFNNVACLEACNFIKKRLQHNCFPMNIEKFLWKFYLKNTTGGCFCTFIWWHIKIVKLMTYLFNIKYFVSLSCISSFFSQSVLKYVKLIVFENYNECKRKHVFN